MCENVASGSGCVPPELHRKKRVKTGDFRKDAQLRRNSGEPYKTTNNTFALGRKAPSMASCKCKFACKSITLNARVDMFKTFWDIAKYTEQQNFLMRSVESTDVNRRRHGTNQVPELSRRQHTYKYFLILPGLSKVEVCRKTFCETFNIGEKRIKLVCQKVAASDLMVIKDMRGGKRLRRNQAWKPKIIDFISSLPTRHSHYGREKSAKNYLSEELNIRKLHTAFVIKYTENNIKPPVSRQWFNSIFKKYFNLSFGQPKVDTCPKCDLYKNEMKTANNPEKRKEVQLKRDVHHSKAKAAQNMMSRDCTNAKLEDYPCVVSYDLQKQFYIPALTHTQMYYSRQLACVNFGVHLEDEGTGFFYFWVESTGKRGCNEIGTCVFDYVSNELNTTKTSFIFWSDNCGGQNKNQGILAVYISLVAKGKANEITHKFPQSGHTFLSCDRDFGLIEKVKRRKKPEVPRDLIKIITSARQKKPAFTVKLTDSFFDWMALAKETLTTEHLGISQIVMLRISKDLIKEGVVEVKNNYSDLCPFRRVKIFKGNVKIDYFEKLNVDLSIISKPKKLWPAAKSKEIRAMIPYLKEKNKAYYEKLLEKMKE